MSMELSDNFGMPAIVECPSRQTFHAGVGEAVCFLQHWPCFPILSASHTNPLTGETRVFETKAFPYPVKWMEVARWIDARQGKVDLFFNVNSLVASMDMKREYADVASVLAFQVDADVRPSKDQERGIARIIKMFEGYKLPPSLIVSSGGGAQAFWLLETPLEIDGNLEKAEDARLINIQLERDLQGDNCHDIDRIMRVPGTINVRNAFKIRWRRKRSFSRIHSYPATKYPLSAFVRAVTTTIDCP